MYDEDDLISISALQHLLFCERRAALVFMEGLWEDNIYTAQGTVLHEQAHQIETEARGDMRIVRGLWLRSLHLGLVGHADIVEFHRLEAENPDKGIMIVGTDGSWQPIPIEYKRGRLRNEEGYEIQLCAQALCLEEMLHVHMASGALFYGKTKRRLPVTFDYDLRQQTVAAALRLHGIIQEVPILLNGRTVLTKSHPSSSQRQTVP
jgi:CRISPR-associated exonuclease Cas4